MATSPSQDSQYPIITDLINELLSIQAAYRTVSIDGAIAEVVCARQTKASLVENLEAKDTIIANLTTLIANLTTDLGAKLPSSTYTKEDILAKLLQVDVNDSGINATTIQGKAITDLMLQASQAGNMDVSGYILIPIKDSKTSTVKNLILQWGSTAVTAASSQYSTTGIYNNAVGVTLSQAITKIVGGSAFSDSTWRIWGSSISLSSSTSALFNLLGLGDIFSGQTVKWWILGY